MVVTNVDDLGPEDIAHIQPAPLVTVVKSLLTDEPIKFSTILILNQV